MDIPGTKWFQYYIWSLYSPLLMYVSIIILVVSMYAPYIIYNIYMEHTLTQYIFIYIYIYIYIHIHIHTQLCQYMLPIYTVVSVYAPCTTNRVNICSIYIQLCQCMLPIHSCVNVCSLYY